jgi:CheY-like chemotaxis protein
MPIHWVIEPHALVFLFEGRHETVDMERALTESRLKATGLPLLLDISQTQATPNSAETQDRLNLMRQFMPPLAPRIAVVAADATRFGIASVVKVQAERVGIECRVFGSWEAEEARQWLAQGGEKAGLRAARRAVSEVAPSPPVREEGPPEEPAEIEPPLPRGSETILVVEDEDAIRALACEYLMDLGYTVLEARSGSKALEMAARHKGPVHLVLTDLMMPGMNGRELWLVLAPLHPEARVLFVSGYSEIDIVRHGALKPGTALLQKPFEVSAVARKVREVLDS